ncbi:unnamed protein product [Enterobius vermicularis]|uniref:Uncharacterized protein n=1 Tax=Enterobius vermicularis TaxID=51028 RepID=A0A0N4UWB3_ENTVE|nr:unnamed protein product [Enterobius vermicularis]
MTKGRRGQLSRPSGSYKVMTSNRKFCPLFSRLVTEFFAFFSKIFVM